MPCDGSWHMQTHPVTCASNKLAAATLLRQTDGTALRLLWRWEYFPE